MSRFSLAIISIVVSSTAMAQNLHIGVFGGAAAYNGDLTDKILPKKVTNGAIGITGNYEITDQIMARAGLTYAIVGGADRFSEKPDLVLRNLSFESSILELSAVGEYYLFNLYDRRYSPYIYAGLAIFKFDPYAYHAGKNKVYLQRLGTEGQGISGYRKKKYSTTQLSIPIGGGLKFAVTENIRIGIELGMRKLFTDYLDDVSGNYADPNDLLAANGQVAVDMSYRGDEVPGGSSFYPTKGAQRGSPEYKDWYYFTGIHLTYRPGGKSGGGFFGSSNRKSGTGCPINVY